MMIPIGMSLVRHVRTLVGAPPNAKTNFGVFMTLGTFYASIAGGTATIMGVPHNAIAVSLLESLTGRQLGFFEWMMVGVPVFLSLLVDLLCRAVAARAAGDQATCVAAKRSSAPNERSSACCGRTSGACCSCS